MDWLKRNPVSGLMLLLLGALLAAAGGFDVHQRGQSRRALMALDRKRQERIWLEQQSPAPTEANEQGIAGDLANTRKVLAALRSSLQGREEGEPRTAPARASDLYFDLATFVEGARAAAALARVQTSPEEHFGFGSHALEGPAAGLVSTVFRQRVAVECLISVLLETHPQALHKVQRERPVADNGGRVEDFFEFDPALSVRVPGQVDSDAFRLEFTGQTGVLRELLNAFAAFRLPVIVRSVEVEPLAEAGSPAPGSMPAGSPVPLVSGNLAKFVLVVELLRFAPETTGPKQ